MSQTILVEPDVDLNKVFSLNLSTYTGTDIIERHNALEVIELLKILPSISLIITKSDISGEKTAKEIHEFLSEHKMDIPMIVLGECQELKEERLTIKEPISWEDLVKNAGKLLGVNERELSKKVQPKFYPIGIKYFYDIDHTPCDVYIRIKKSNSEYQFVKRIHEQDSFTHEDIDKYQKQGLKEFYIPKDYQQYFVTFVTNSIVDKLEKELTLGQRLTTNSHAYDIVREHVNKVGLTEEIIELAETNISSMIKSIKGAPKLAGLLRFLLSNKISYAYQKSHLTCIVGNFIMSRQSWYEERHLTTFTYLSFFSDITLKTVKQMRVNSLEELDNTELTEEERSQVLTHAKDATNLIKEFPSTNEYLELVITQHQGSTEGIGFVDDPGQEIHPIARVYIVSDAFVKMMLDPQSPKTKKDILTILYMQFSDASFQKIIKVLEQKIE